MRRDDKMHEHGRQVEDMFDWMHRHTGPRAGVDVSMVQTVYGAIQRWPVKYPVDEVEVRRCQYRHCQQPEQKCQRIFVERQGGNDSVGRAPKIENLIDRPDRGAASQGPEDVVPDLTSKRELSALRQLFARIVFQSVFL